MPGAGGGVPGLLAARAAHLEAALASPLVLRAHHAQVRRVPKSLLPLHLLPPPLANRLPYPLAVRKDAEVKLPARVPALHLLLRAVGHPGLPPLALPLPRGRGRSLGSRILFHRCRAAVLWAAAVSSQLSLLRGGSKSALALQRFVHKVLGRPLDVLCDDAIAQGRLVRGEALENQVEAVQVKGIFGESALDVGLHHPFPRPHHDLLQVRVVVRQAGLLAFGPVVFRHDFLQRAFQVLLVETVERPKEGRNDVGKL
mmetsp:Transcript_8369/g.23935  ORF Transcript_8369/g.23935 Transcript_8369/m.23935 type:complete len:256 (+) Transcript_8369:858-1625(+)